MQYNLGLNILLIIIAYLLGSIPSAVWIGKFFFGKDVREHGSGNAGTTNTFRVLGAKAGFPVFFIDVIKAALAVKLIYFTDYYIPQTGDYINFQFLLGAAALIGHIFPVFAQFKGGKGVASLLGIVFAIHPWAALSTFVLWFILLLITKYVSLSSMIAAFTFPIILIVVFETRTPSLLIFSFIIFVLLLFTHQKNIERLISREESKTHIIGRKKHKKKLEQEQEQ